MPSILGLNAYHGDSAACLVIDGQLVAAAEEERFRRIKHWAGLPTEAIRYCLSEANLQLSGVDHIAINRNPKVNNPRRIAYVLTNRPDLRLVLNRMRNIGKAASVERSLQDAFPAAPIRAHVHHIEHHLAHLASAFLVSDFDQAVCVSVDGFGDFASAAWGMGQGIDITIDGRVYFPHSLGIFYSALTQYLGFPHFGDEYKVMGLAPYGKPCYLEPLRQVVKLETDGTFRLNLKYFRHHRENVAYKWNDCSPEIGTLYTPALEQLLGPARQQGEPLNQKHKDFARSTQALYEEAFFHLLNHLHARYQCPNLALSGGCAMNSVANGKIYQQTPFKRLYLPAAAGDAGGAIGAAFVVSHRVTREDRSLEIEDRQSAPTRESRETTRNREGGETPRAQAGLRTTDQGTTDEQEEDRTPHPIPLPNAEREAHGETHRAQRSAPSAIRPTLPPNSYLPSANSSARRAVVLTHAYWGPGYSTDTIHRLLESRTEALKAAECQVHQPSTTEALCQQTAKAIAAGQVIGWFQGRMEWGPRALGNRSILCDPRRADMKDILNQKIKRRESFRPFAPSILREAVSEWFETDDDVPFMMQVFQVRHDKRPQIPAVTHADGSGRLHTVTHEANPLYHSLISQFNHLTSVPILLNTSFNENEPVVCRPEEALDCFLRTKMDVLVLGEFLIERLTS